MWYTASRHALHEFKWFSTSSRLSRFSRLSKQLHQLYETACSHNASQLWHIDKPVMRFRSYPRLNAFCLLFTAYALVLKNPKRTGPSTPLLLNPICRELIQTSRSESPPLIGKDLILIIAGYRFALDVMKSDRAHRHQNHSDAESVKGVQFENDFR